MTIPLLHNADHLLAAPNFAETDYNTVAQRGRFATGPAVLLRASVY